MPDRSDDLDRLYQLPLDQFTAARNALAKERGQPEIKALEKPNVAAWGVNQLYWHDRTRYDRVISSSERLRGEHRKLLAGKPSDIRDAEKAHRDAVREALDRVKALLAGAGHPATDQTLAAVQETLSALPAGDAPGRLTRPLKPLGFEALAGMPITSPVRPALRVVRSAPVESPAPRDSRKERELAKQREREERERKARQREAEKAMLEAEQAVKDAEKALAALRATRDAAVSDYQRARLRAHE
jgi:hypothetical protein